MLEDLGSGYEYLQDKKDCKTYKIYKTIDQIKNVNKSLK